MATSKAAVLKKIIANKKKLPPLPPTQPPVAPMGGGMPPAPMGGMPLQQPPMGM